jgi:hypothetical protein
LTSAEFIGRDSRLWERVCKYHPRFLFINAIPSLRFLWPFVFFAGLERLELEILRDSGTSRDGWKMQFIFAAVSVCGLLTSFLKRTDCIGEKFLRLDKRLSLKDIESRVCLWAGERDHITPKERAFNPEKKPGTAEARLGWI